MINHDVPQPCTCPTPWPDFAPYLTRVLELLHLADETGLILSRPALEIAKWEEQGVFVDLETGALYELEDENE